MKKFECCLRVLILASSAAWMAGLSGCTSVQIKSIPTNAQITQLPSRTNVGNTPYTVGNITSPRSFELKKDDYEPETVTVTPSSPSSITVELKRNVEIRSIPEGAQVYKPGENALLGSTPYHAKIGSQTEIYEIRKRGYLSEIINVVPTASRILEVYLELDVSGKKLLEVVIGQDGLEVRSTPVHSEEEVIERSPNVTAVRRLTNFSESRNVNFFTLSLDNKSLIVDILDNEIVEGQAPTYYSNLWEIDSANIGGMKRITDGKYFDRHAAYSPNGEFLYFSSNRAGPTSIFRLSIEKLGGLGLVTSAATFDTFPQISPNGETLMYTANMISTTTPQLWSQPLKGGLPKQLREGSNERWSPDGSTILYSALDPNTGKTKIWTMVPDGSAPIQLTHSSDYNDINPFWSPDGSRIVFASDRGLAGSRPNYDIWIMNSDGSNPKQLTTNGSWDDHPVIADDDKTIFFRSNRGLKWDIWVMEMAEDEDVIQ